MRSCSISSKVGYNDLLGSFRYFIPFVAVGLVSSILGFSPINSYRLMFFWLIGVFAAGVIGLESDQAALRKTLFWTFTVFVALSILTVVVDPKLGVMADSRVEGGGGAWRGLFPGKNLTGLICVYTLIMAWFAPRPAPYIRAAAAAMAAWSCLVFAASQGAISLTVIVIEYVVLVGLMRRSNLSRGVQATLLVVVMGATVATLLISATFLFQLLGRDATLSGRTVIWTAFLMRASYFWLLGAGPGSFSLPGFADRCRSCGTVSRIRLDPSRRTTCSSLPSAKPASSVCCSSPFHCSIWRSSFRS